MNRTRGISMTALAGAALLALTGCVGGQVDTSSDEAPGSEQDADARVLRLAHTYEPSHPFETCGVAAINESLSGSGLQIESYPSSQLGSEAEALEQVASGSLDATFAGAAFLGTWYEDAGVLDAPYLFDDVDSFFANIDSDAIQEIWDGLEEKSGLAVESSWYFGTRQVSANKPVREPADLAGVKLRTPDAPLYITGIGDMGGTATPMALDEVYTSLQQGAIDGQEAPVPNFDSMGLAEVQDYVNLTGHIVQASNVVTSSDLLESFSDDELAAWETALDTGKEAAQECILDEEQEIVEKWKADGTVEVVEDVDTAAFAESVRSQLPDQVSFGELYTKIVESQK
ncbi:DctP family TRAP transporter solute-binding subunit [Microbacterium halophytorum]|uniref:DctP family TRAP transporter solute-binding subunit n=1 Tax=Microbacterium halophytorum TaxID=2067568 RepID=UPI000CFD2915|nr:DctP family TRAP transporter solute-binding subunit [Microbacterium halophytorum]